MSNTIDAIAAQAVEQRELESASAGSACQTTSSHFAYALTAGVLGVITLIAFSLVMIVYAALSSYVYTDGFTTDDTYFDFEYGYDDWGSDEQDYDEWGFEDDLLRHEFMSY